MSVIYPDPDVSVIEIQFFCWFQPVKPTHFGWLNHRVLVDVAPISVGLSICQPFFGQHHVC